MADRLGNSHCQTTSTFEAQRMDQNTEETSAKIYSIDAEREKRLGLSFGGRPPGDEDWLSGMAVGTEFLARLKRMPEAQAWILQRFMQAGGKNGNILIIPMEGEEPVPDDKRWLWVDPVAFCKAWEFKGFLLIPEDR